MANGDVVGDQGLKNPPSHGGSSKTRVLETSTWRMESSHQYPAARFLSVNGLRGIGDPAERENTRLKKIVADQASTSTCSRS